jgi:hypothetical protein
LSECYSAIAESALHVAVANNNVKLAQFLIINGADAMLKVLVVVVAVCVV